MTRMIHTSEAQHDPVTIGTAIFAALGAAEIGGTVIVGSLTVASLVGSVVIGAALTGAQYALSKLSKPNDFGGDYSISAINAPSVSGNVAQSDAPQRIVYGSPRIGGAYFFFDDSEPPYLVIGTMLSRRAISRVRAMSLNNNLITFEGNGNNQILTPVAISDQPYFRAGSSRLKACFRNGNPSQPVDALLLQQFPDLDPNFRQQGIATATFRFEYGEDQSDFQKLWGNVSVPNPLLDVDGCPVYDPRDPTQRFPLDWRDPFDVADAMATWRFTANAALVQADWLASPLGMAFPPDRIDWDKIAAAADFDDEPVATREGTYIRRHEIHGVVQLKGQTSDDVMTAMLTANRGFAVQAKGRGWISSSTPQEPVLTIDDSMLLKGFEFRINRQKRDLVNSVTGEFASQDREYQQIQAPVYDRPDLQEQDGELLPQAIQTPFTADYRAVERIQKQFLLEARLERAITLPAVSLRALGLTPGLCVKVWSRIFPQMNGLYTANPIGLLDDISGLSMTLNEYDPGIPLDFDANVDETPFDLPDIGLS